MNIRAFLALNFSMAVTRRISDEAGRRREILKPVLPAGVQLAWVPAANLHLTVKFLGSVPEASLEGVRDVLRRRLQQHSPFELRARGLGAFPDVCQPRVLWVGIETNEALTKLQRETEEAMTALGFDKEEQPYRPHVTVARVRGDVPCDLTGHWASDADFGASVMGELVIYESRTLREGTEYIARARVGIGASAEPRPEL